MLKSLFKKFKKTIVFKTIQKTIPYRALRKVYRACRKQIRRMYRYEMLRKHYPKLYNKYAARPVNEKKVVFIEVRESKISDSFSLMYKKVQEEHKYEIHTHFLRSGFSKRKDYQHACEAMITDIADAKYIFLNESSDVIAALPMRKETIVTQLWHGCGAFKKFGMSTAPTC